jgi:hypothetical protein
MKNTHSTIAGTILSLLFVIIGFAAIYAAVLSAGGVPASYTASLVIFLIVLWLLMLLIMHDRENTAARKRR